MFHRQVTLDGLIGEHIAIRGHMELVRGITREWEKLLASAANSQPSYDEIQALEDKLASLRQAMGHLEDGLIDHHEHEEEVMPALVGDLLMKAILIEHDETLKMMKEIRTLVDNNSLEVFLEQGTDIMHSINDLCRLASAHSLKEDGILLLLKKAPELR